MTKTDISTLAMKPSQHGGPLKAGGLVSDDGAFLAFLEQQTAGMPQKVPPLTGKMALSPTQSTSGQTPPVDPQIQVAPPTLAIASQQAPELGSGPNNEVIRAADAHVAQAPVPLLSMLGQEATPVFLPEVGLPTISSALPQPEQPTTLNQDTPEFDYMAVHLSAQSDVDDDNAAPFANYVSPKVAPLATPNLAKTETDSVPQTASRGDPTIQAPRDGQTNPADGLPRPAQSQDQSASESSPIQVEMANNTGAEQSDAHSQMSNLLPKTAVPAAEKANPQEASYSPLLVRDTAALNMTDGLPIPTLPVQSVSMPPPSEPAVISDAPSPLILRPNLIPTAPLPIAAVQDAPAKSTSFVGSSAPDLTIVSNANTRPVLMSNELALKGGPHFSVAKDAAQATGAVPNTSNANAHPLPQNQTVLQVTMSVQQADIRVASSPTVSQTQTTANGVLHAHTVLQNSSQNKANHSATSISQDPPTQITQAVVNNTRLSSLAQTSDVNTKALEPSPNDLESPIGISQEPAQNPERKSLYSNVFAPTGFSASVSLPPATHSPSIPSIPVPVSAILEQIKTHAPPGKQSSIELTLTPDDLGKIRLVIATDGEKVRVIVHADRPETLDLIRRNTDSFSADLRQAGYSNASFSFGGSHDRQSAQQDQKGTNHTFDAEADDPVSDIATPKPQADHSKPSGLNLRV
jgi:hypothetical protein